MSRHIFLGVDHFLIKPASTLFHMILITLKHISCSLILTFTWPLSMSTNIIVVFMNVRSKMRCIFGLALTPSTMKSTRNKNLSILISTSLIVPTCFLQVLFVVYSVTTICSILMSLFIFTIDNCILFTLVSTSAFLTSILNIVTGNMTTTWFYFY